jgi:hypothetical protein
MGIFDRNDWDAALRRQADRHRESMELGPRGDNTTAPIRNQARRGREVVILAVSDVDEMHRSDLVMSRPRPGDLPRGDS